MRLGSSIDLSCAKINTRCCEITLSLVVALSLDDDEPRTSPADDDEDCTTPMPQSNRSCLRAWSLGAWCNLCNESP